MLVFCLVTAMSKMSPPLSEALNTQTHRTSLHVGGFRDGQRCVELVTQADEQLACGEQSGGFRGSVNECGKRRGVPQTPFFFFFFFTSG